MLDIKGLEKYIYCQEDNILLLHGDCIEIMPYIENESIDMIFTDPPYGISNNNKFKFKKNIISHDFGKWDWFKDDNEFWNFTFNWIDNCIKVLRKGGMFFTYFDMDKINFISYYLKKNGFKYKDYFADLKSNPMPQLRKVKWASAWEIIGMWWKEGAKLTYNYQLGQQFNYKLRPVVGHTTKEDGDREHPTQKPISICKLFISYWSNKGDLILDPFIGSGTTAVACKELGRKCIGIDIDEKWLEVAKNRLRQEVLL